MRNFTWNRFPIKNLLIDSLLTPIVESKYLNCRAVWSCDAVKKQRENRWPFGEFPVGESCLSLLELKRRNQKRRLPGAHCTVVKLFSQLRLRYICKEHSNSRISLWGVNIDALGGKNHLLISCQNAERVKSSGVAKRVADDEVHIVLTFELWLTLLQK